MRINGFEQIKAFYSWVFNNPDKVRPTHISLYLFLWNQGNRANWVEWFKCPYDLAMQGACIGSKSTYYKCLDDLQNYKLIEYKKGLNNYKAPQIHLIKLYKSEQLTAQVTVPLSEPQTEPLTVLLTGNIYKLVTTNYKLVNSDLEKWLDLESDIITDESIHDFETQRYKDALSDKFIEFTNRHKLDKDKVAYTSQNAYNYYKDLEWKNSRGKEVKNLFQTIVNNWFKELGDFKSINKSKAGEPTTW